MREAGAPSTRDVAGMRLAWCARPTGGSHGRTVRGPAQRRGGAERRPRQKCWQDGRGQQQQHYKGRSPKALSRRGMIYAGP